MNKGLVLFGLLSGLATVSSAAFVDDFNLGAYDSGLLTAGSNSQWISAGNVPGGIRYAMIEVQNNEFGDDGRARTFATSGVYNVSSGTGVDVKTLLGYGFSSGSSTPDAPLNLNWAGSPVFLINVRNTDLSVPVTVEIGSTTLGQSATRMGTLPAAITAGNVPVNFDFTGEAFLGDVDYIKVTFDPQSEGDFTITDMQVVPEPATIAGVSVALLAFARRRRRK